MTDLRCTIDRAYKAERDDANPEGTKPTYMTKHTYVTAVARTHTVIVTKKEYVRTGLFS